MATKVAIVNPGRSQRFTVHEPLNVAYLASYLEMHHVDVRIIDEPAGQDVERSIKEFNPDIVGVTATTTIAPEAYAIVDRCKRLGFLTVMGGVHATIFPEEALQHADVVVKGEGEIAFMDIITSKIKKGVITAPYIRDLDEIPPPSRHLLDMDFYLRTKDRVPYIIYYAFVPPNTRIAGVMTSRGCPYSCIYCHNIWRGLPVRFHSPQRVISEIESLKEKHRIRALYFVEDNFFVNRKKAREICEQMIRKNFDLIWGAATRADNVDPETLELAKAAGCRLVNFGFESGSQRILDILGKGLKVETSRKAIEMCNRAGLMANGSFMLGNPTETTEDLELTHRFVRQNKITMPAFYITTPYPGTELWTVAKERRLLPEKIDWAEFAQERVVANFSEVPKEKIEQLRAEWYLEYFLANKREALRLILLSLRYPRASFEKIVKTLIPLLKKLFAR